MSRKRIMMMMMLVWLIAIAGDTVKETGFVPEAFTKLSKVSRHRHIPIETKKKALTYYVISKFLRDS